MALSNDITFSTDTWWEEEKDIRGLKYATVGAIVFVLLGIIITVMDGINNESGRATIIITFLAMLGAFSGFMGIAYEEKFLFRWNEVPGKYNTRLIEYLEWKFQTGWIKTANIEKIDNDTTLKVSYGKNYFLLRLNDEETKVYITIDDGRTNEFNAKAETGKLNIYEDSSLYGLV